MYIRNIRVIGVQFLAYCHEKKLVIELDGGVHDIKVNKEYDEARTALLAGLDIYVLRFRNEEIVSNVEAVLNKINEIADRQDLD